MKKQLAVILISFASTICAIAEPKPITTGPYVLTSISLDQEGELNPHHFTTYSAHIVESDGEYTISIQYGRVGIIKLPLHVSGDRVSFFVTPTAGSIDGQDILAKGFFGERSADYIAGWSTTGEDRKAFKLVPYQATTPKSAANKAE